MNLIEQSTRLGTLLPRSRPPAPCWSVTLKLAGSRSLPELTQPNRST